MGEKTEYWVAPTAGLLPSRMALVEPTVQAHNDA